MQHAEVLKANGAHVNETASVLIRVPAHQDYIVVVRSAVAQLGARMGYTVAELIDLRLAVDEACCLLVGAGGEPRDETRHDPPDGPPRGDLECRVRVGVGTLQVTVAAPAADVETPDKDGFGWNVLRALVDSLAWARDGATARIELMKRRTGLPR